jgi:regulator of protease activity HflC (stomatin/prohibitin superfamily)
MKHLTKNVLHRILMRVHIRKHEIGLLFKDNAFERILEPGIYHFLDPKNRLLVSLLDERHTMWNHANLREVVKAGALEGRALLLDLKEDERAIVTVNGTIHAVLDTGQYVFPNTFNDVSAEVLTVTGVRFDHPKMTALLNVPGTATLFTVHQLDAGTLGLLYVDGVFEATLHAGRHVFHRKAGTVKVQRVDLRERVLDVGGQDIMTEDKVSIRLNAVVGYRVADARKFHEATEDAAQALYRDTQLALRATVGTRNLDTLLAEKDAVTAELAETLRQRAAHLGCTVEHVGIRDIILPGDMKDLMNKVTEAKKAAEANLIVRREETAAMRSQVNTAKLLENNPTLMRLRELEVLEKIAGHNKLNVVLGEKGLADRVMNLL